MGMGNNIFTEWEFFPFPQFCHVSINEKGPGLTYKQSKLGRSKSINGCMMRAAGRSTVPGISEFKPLQFETFYLGNSKSFKFNVQSSELPRIMIVRWFSKALHESQYTSALNPTKVCSRQMKNTGTTTYTPSNRG